MHDFHCKNADDMYYNVLAQRVRYFKEDKEGTETMCKIMDELCDIAAREARQEYSIQIAGSLIAVNKLTNEDIAHVTGLTLAEVQSLRERQPA